MFQKWKKTNYSVIMSEFLLPFNSIIHLNSWEIIWWTDYLIESKVGTNYYQLFDWIEWIYLWINYFGLKL